MHDAPAQNPPAIVRPFTFFTAIHAAEPDGEIYSLAKAASAQAGTKEGKDADWFVHAPIALTDDKDFDGQMLTEAGVDAGLAIHERLGGHIDYAHKFLKSKDLDDLVGRRAGTPVIDGETNLITRLFKSKTDARKIWTHLGDGGSLGYSLQGVCKAVDPRNRQRVTGMDIYIVTIDAMPKGFEATRLKMGKPGNSMGEIIKSISDELASGDLHAWTTDDAWGNLVKAITTGDGLPSVESTGGEAVRREPTLRTAPDQWRCPACETLNHTKRKTCRQCGLQRKKR